MARLAAPERPGWFARLAIWALRRREGRVPVTIGILAHHPSALGSFMAFGSLYLRWGALPAKLKRLVHLRVALRVGCPS